MNWWPSGSCDNLAQENLQPGDRLPTEQGLAEILAPPATSPGGGEVLAASGASTSARRRIFVASAGGSRGRGLVHFQPTDMEQVIMLLDYRRLSRRRRAARRDHGDTDSVRAIRSGAGVRAAGAANRIEEFAAMDAGP